MRVVFCLSSVVVGFAYWWQADWWAYVMFPEGPMPKFTMPSWFQAIVSGVVGAFGGGVVVGAWWACRRVHGGLPMGKWTHHDGIGSGPSA